MSLRRSVAILLTIISFFVVGFGQPAWSFACSILAAVIGYALFFRVLLSIESAKRRFWLGTLWFAGVQLIQLSWFVSHPYSYIYIVYLALAFAMGLQFGLLALFAVPSRVSLKWILGLSGFWVVMEWARLYFLSGFSFNPIGLSLSASLYALQLASLWGIYGLSFWVLFTNLLFLKVCLKPRLLPLWVLAAAFPYLYGVVHLQKHHKEMAMGDEKFHAVLVQPSFPIEECLNFKSSQQLTSYALEEWRQILRITKKNLGQPFDLLVLPEGVVPYGTYSCVYSSTSAIKAFKEIFGVDSLKHLPPLKEPLAVEVKSGDSTISMVNNAYWAQALANVFQTEVIAGLEDAEDVGDGKREYYSSAIHFKPLDRDRFDFNPFRYEKRVLVPMGEYIPFPFLAKMAEKYGVFGSFTPGKEAKVAPGKKAIGLSICYEETYGNLMRENKLKGAEVLVNLTSDIWYPNSRLVRQHFDHARLRTVENGLPLLRACNTGITAGIDSLGRVIAQLGEDRPDVETISDSLKVSIPTYIYTTVYSYTGDSLIIGFSLLSMLCCFIPCRK